MFTWDGEGALPYKMFKLGVPSGLIQSAWNAEGGVPYNYRSDLLRSLRSDDIRVQASESWSPAEALRSVKVSLSSEKFSEEDTAACCASESIV